MASGHVNRINRPNTWLHRPCLQREENPCQLGAVHTCAGFSDAGNDGPIDALMRPASEKRQGTKSRKVVHPTVQRTLWGFGRDVTRGEDGPKRTIWSLFCKAWVFVAG